MVALLWWPVAVEIAGVSENKVKAVEEQYVFRPLDYKMRRDVILALLIW